MVAVEQLVSRVKCAPQVAAPFLARPDLPIVLVAVSIPSQTDSTVVVVTNRVPAVKSVTTGPVKLAVPQVRPSVVANVSISKSIPTIVGRVEPLVLLGRFVAQVPASCRAKRV